MEQRSAQKNGMVNLLALLVIGVAALAISRLSHTLAGHVSVLFMGVGVLVAAVSWFQMRLEERERVEKLELDELTRSKGGSALFETQEAEAFPARRAREQFEKYFIPIFTSVLFILQATGAWFYWQWASKPDSVKPIAQATMALALFGLIALVYFLLGKFSATMARLENQRLARPTASYLLLSAYISALAAVAIAGSQAGFPRADKYIALGLCVVLGIIAVETLLNLVLELYRPRVKGKIGRPLYESRLVGLLSQPEGLVTTAAQALDYQFGFKVSDTWFYRFFEKALGWLLLLQLGVLLASTSVVFIEAGEQGVLERFGKPVENRTVLNAGLHFKFPWPIDIVHRFRTEQVQNFNVGFTPDQSKQKESVVLWTVTHSKEENFIVANRDQNWSATTNAAGKRTPPVSLLVVSIPVQFQVTNVLSWVYNNEDSPALLEDLATREVVRYLAGVDMNAIMSSGRLQASEDLRSRIQNAADERGLGANIISVGLQDLHPPVKVAPDFEKVVAAVNTREAKILAARAEAIRTNALAEAQALTTVNRAHAESQARTVGALAQAALFTNQIPAFKAAPSVYAQRAYLDAFARATANARKYVILTTNTQDVLTFDLQDRIRDDLLNLRVQTPNK